MVSPPEGPPGMGDNCSVCLPQQSSVATSSGGIGNRKRQTLREVHVSKDLMETFLRCPLKFKSLTLIVMFSRWFYQMG